MSANGDNASENGADQLNVETLMEAFGMTEEGAQKLLQALPQICEAFSRSQPAGQQPAQPRNSPYPYPAPDQQAGAENLLGQQPSEELTEEILKALFEEYHQEIAQRGQGDLNIDSPTLINILADAGYIDDASVAIIDGLCDDGKTALLNMIDNFLETTDAIPTDEELGKIIDEAFELPKDQNRNQAARAILNPIITIIRRSLTRPGQTTRPQAQRPQTQPAGQTPSRLEQILRQLFGGGQARQPYPYPYPAPAPQRQRQRPGSRFNFPAFPRINFPRVQFPTLNSIDCDGKQKFVDAIVMDLQEDSITITEDGRLIADCVATAAMVQKYGDMKVLKDPDELQKAADFARMIPITDQHPPEGVVMNQDEVKGWTSPVQYDTEKRNIKCSVDIKEPKLIKKIQDEKKLDVSIGFYCDLDKTPGEFDGEPYDAVQRNIVLNHLAAGIDRGRCPSGICGIEGGNADTSGDEEMTPDPVEPAAEPAGEDVDVATHEKLMNESIAGMEALMKKIKEGAGTMKPAEINPLLENLSDMTWDLKRTIRTVNTKNMDVADTVLDSGKKILEDYETFMLDLEVPEDSGDDDNDDDEDADQEMKYMLEEKNGHTHEVELNKEGNGTSTEEAGHTHKVIGKKVMFANEHTHKLKEMKKEDGTTTTEGEDADQTPEPRTDAEKALDAKREETIDNIMDFKPPNDRDHFKAMNMDQLENTLTLLKSQAGGDGIPRGASDSTGEKGRRKAIDDAYAKISQKK